jgi:hypothetical protein
MQVLRDDLGAEFCCQCDQGQPERLIHLVTGRTHLKKARAGIYQNRRVHMNLPLWRGKVQTEETDRQGGIFALVKICGIWTLAVFLR